MLTDEAGSGNTEYLEFIRKQADDAAMLHEKHKDQKLAKRRPKYFDDAAALKLAKEKVEQLKDLAD